MAEDRTEDESRAHNAAQFATTHWSVVLAAGDSASPDSQEALEKLCQTYWFPLYAFVRRKGYSPEDAKDLTQGFFERLLAKGFLKAVMRERGRFRGFLLSAVRHFLANEWDRMQTVKRGGRFSFLSLDAVEGEARYQAEPFSEDSPDRLFDLSWARSVMDQALKKLEVESTRDGRKGQFEVLVAFLSAPAEDGAYEAAARQLETTRHAVANSVLRLRQAYGHAVRQEVAHTVASAGEVDEEIRYLVALLTQEGLTGEQNPAT